MFINGKSLGIIALNPYVLEIPRELLKEKNTLEIRVTNSAANEYLFTDSFDKWQPWQLTAYYERENIFHADSLSSGLYGPVKVLY